MDHTLSLGNGTTCEGLHKLPWAPVSHLKSSLFSFGRDYCVPQHYAQAEGTACCHSAAKDILNARSKRQSWEKAQSPRLRRGGDKELTTMTWVSVGTNQNMQAHLGVWLN